MLCQRVEKVIGVELNEQAIEDAKENAAINEVDNVAYHCGKAEDLLPDITNNMRHCLDVVGIVDPPRAGLRKLLLFLVLVLLKWQCSGMDPGFSNWGRGTKHYMHCTKHKVPFSLGPGPS